MAIGNINLDITLKVPRIPAPEENVRAEDLWISLGGAATNYAIAVSKLGHRAYLVARAGSEVQRLGFLKKLADEGVDLTYIDVVDEPVGVVVILIHREKGEWQRSMITLRGANEGLSVDMIPELSCDVTHFSSVKPKIVVEAKPRSRVFSYDPGGESFRAPLEVRKALEHVDIAFLNENELKAITKENSIESATSLIGGKLKFLIVKRGSEGAVAFDSAGVIAEVRGPSISSPLDVTGAGDAFDAAFNVSYLTTNDIHDALRYAAAAGAAKVLKKGSSSMPTIDEINKVLKSFFKKQ